MALTFSTSASENDLQKIIELQKKSLHYNITAEERSDQGFLMASHRLEDLKRMNDIEPHIICKDQDKLVSYVLTMTAESQNDLPVLVPMFEAFKNLTHKGKPVADYNYMVVGQVCVDKDYRGQGIFDKSYNEFKSRLKEKYDFAITEIASVNVRSKKAHKRIGFRDIQSYTAPNGVDWDIVIWEW